MDRTPKNILKQKKNNSRAFNLTIAEKLLGTQISFSHEIEKYFLDLKQSFIAIARYLSPEELGDLQEQVIIQDNLHRSHPQRTRTEITPDHMFDSLIFLAYYHITGLFFYSLEVYHKSQTKFPTLQSSLEDGWRFIQEYFQTWKDAIGLPKGSYRSQSKTVDWSNIQQVIFYFLTWDSDSKTPYSFVKYLCDQWANEIYHCPHILKPPRSISQDI